jgi:hypothetical protein
LRGRDENSRATCCGEKARLQALKKSALRPCDRAVIPARPVFERR